MNWEQVEGHWEQFKGKMREQWGKLTDNDIAVIGGKKDQLLGKLRTQYGLSKEQAEREIEVFLDRCEEEGEDFEDEDDEQDIVRPRGSTNYSSKL